MISTIEKRVSRAQAINTIARVLSLMRKRKGEGDALEESLLA